MRDICEWSTMNQYRCMFECLYKVWLDCIFHQYCRSTFCLDILDSNRLTIICVCNNTSADSFLKIMNIFGKAENRHNFCCDCNYKTIFSFNTVCLLFLCDCNGTQCTVIHIHTSLPDNTFRINIQRISLINGIIQYRSNQIVCGCNSMHITCKMQIDGFHRNNLCITAASCTTFKTKYRT